MPLLGKLLNLFSVSKTRFTVSISSNIHFPGCYNTGVGAVVSPLGRLVGKNSSFQSRFFSSSSSSSVKREGVKIMPEIESNDISNLASDVDLCDFDLISTVKANGIHTVNKYVSRSTGLELCHAEVPGPIVHCYIVLATRETSHDGLPHTLEHLIFLGSEDYKYKGVLDILANKCLASGTNAWTDVDHTAYTMKTAGIEGTLRLLPIYMDHIFYPILSDSAFHTEVYHINGEGKDGGVVYSEMQALETTGEVRAHTELVREIYPKESGYHYNTGGELKNLRESCSNAKVKAFHTKYYNPRNCRVIVAGQATPEQLFSALEPTIKKLKEKNSVPKSWDRPWSDEHPELSDNVEKTISFASEEEDDAIVVIGFRGPSAVHQLSEVHALRLLMEYLTDSSVSPIQKEFVENDDPIASSVEYSEMENSQTVFYLQLEGVPKDESKTIPPRLYSTLEKQVEEFDISRMQDIVRKAYQEELSSMENTPHNSIAYAIIGDFLYAQDPNDSKQFESRLSIAKLVEGFLEKDKAFWTERIQKMILERKWVIVHAKPSVEQSELQAKEEAARLEERLYKFGEDGFKKLGADLDDAMANNSIPVPLEVIQSIETPSVESISYHNIVRYDNPEFADGMKCNFYLDDISSNFAYVSLLMDTSSLSVEQRKYLPLFCEAVAESAVKLDDGTVIDHEDVVAELNRDFLNYNVGIGLDAGGSKFKCGSFSHLISFNSQLELAKIPKGFDWIQRLFWKTQFKGDRLRVIANKMSTEVNQLKRKGNRMSQLLLKELLYEEGSNVKLTSMIRQQILLKEVAQTVVKSEGKVRRILETIREVITRPSNTTLHIATSLDKLKAMYGDSMVNGEWQFPKEWCDRLPFNSKEPAKRLANEFDIVWMKDEGTLKDKPQQFVLGLGSEESSFLNQAAQVPITDFNDPEIPMVLTGIQYFSQTEGSFWKAIRGAGFAYDSSLDLRANEGILFFQLYRASNVVDAYKAAMDTIEEHLNGKQEFQEDLLDTAKSSLIFEIIEGEVTPLALASTSLCSYFRNVPQDHTRRLIERIAKVSMKELKYVTEKYFRQLFSKPSNTAIVCPTDKVSTIVQGMGDFGKKMTIMPSVTNSFLAK